MKNSTNIWMENIPTSFIWFLRSGPPYVAQAGLELQGSSNFPLSAPEQMELCVGLCVSLRPARICLVLNGSNLLIYFSFSIIPPPLCEEYYNKYFPKLSASFLCKTLQLPATRWSKKKELVSELVLQCWSFQLLLLSSHNFNKTTAFPKHKYSQGEYE